MSDFLWSAFVDPLMLRSFQKALVGGSLVAIVCGVVGCFIILRRMAFLADALSHAMLAGVTGGFLIMQIVFGHEEVHAPAMFLGSLLAGIITVALIGFVANVSRIKEDTAIGVMYTGIFAAGGLLYSAFSHLIHLDLYHFVTGMVLGIENSDLWLMATITVIVLSVVILFFRQLQITTFDPVMAASIGISVVGMNYVLTACTSLVVVGAVRIVGVILVIGLLVTPAATAYLLTDRLTRMLPLSALFGVMAVVGGAYVSDWVGFFATGPTIVVVSSLQFLLVLVVAPRYGMVADWWRRTTVLPQQLLEDVLGCFRKELDQPKRVGELVNQVGRPADQIHRAIRHLQKREWMTEDGSDALRLTDVGKREARRLLRAHRLWETYLQHVGVPAEALHDRAHRLEHVHDEETVDYLDDKLGHPLRDPHGAEIPEDFEHLVPGEEVRASLLRSGHRAVITRVGEVDDASLDRLAVGAEIVAGERSADEALWTLVLPTGERVELDHRAADAVTVRLLGQGGDEPGSTARDA